MSITSRAAPPNPVALNRAVAWLLQEQSTDGWWSGELETNVTMTAEHVLLFRFLGLPQEEFRNGAIAHILRNQREDGSWALYYDGPADLSTTIEAYVALKVLGVDPRTDAMSKALEVIHRAGGITEARVFTKIWLALFGVYPWGGMPSLPPELVNFPLWMPFNLYDFACWARGTVAPLTVVVSKRPVRDLGVDVDEVFVPGTETEVTAFAAAALANVCRAAAKTLRAVALPARSHRKPNGVSQTGSSSDKKRTAAGAASNRRGCTP